MKRKIFSFIMICVLSILLVGCSVGTLKTTVGEITTGHFTEVNGTMKEGSYSIVSVIFINDTSKDKDFDYNKISISVNDNTYKSIGLYDKIEMSYNSINGEQVKIVKLLTKNDSVKVKAGEILNVKYTFECEIKDEEKVELYYDGKLIASKTNN